MPRKPHGNSKKSKRPHHLYEIRDQKKNDVCEQVSLFNTIVGWMRFFARILLTDIPGGKRAREIEDEYIDMYRKNHARPPGGNRYPKKMTICFKMGKGYT